nr:non-specific lipid-transfer protein A-like [Ipomoea batatas]GME09379.1 non-specific lipid-transfer protein A-like [Ipomoea batatas]
MNRAMAPVIFMAAVLAALRLGQAIDCHQVDSSIASCLPYLQGSGVHPPMNCCDSFRNLLRYTPTQQDRQTACECLKTTAASPDIKPDVAYYLPQNCGLISSFTISRDSNCQRLISNPLPLFEVEDYIYRTVYCDAIEGKLWIAAT